MADRPRFGPAGIPPVFTAMKLPLEEIPGFLRGEGLDAFEYEAIYWGGKPQIKIQHAESLGFKAKENDVWISMHGSYFINLCGEKKIVEASKKRLIACVTAADWMSAHVVVFHPGFYGGKSHEEARRNCLKALKDVVQTVRSLGIRDVKIGPETMGKKSQFGSLDDILDMCNQVEQTQLVIDWSHVHARDGGFLRTVEDFRRVVMRVEDRLGSEATRDMHCHFTKIEFTAKGERRHHTLGDERYGPDFEMLAKTVIEFKLRPVLICESPLLDIDAMRMRDAIKEESERSNA